MKDTNYGSGSRDGWMTVSDPEQARLLTDVESSRYFQPFLGRERSVSEAADEIGCNLDTMLYRVRKFQEAGLLEVVRTEPRRGRPIKYYRSVSDAFFIPFAATPYATLEEHILRQMEPFSRQVAAASARLLQQTGRHGRRIYRKADGEVWNDSASDSDSPFRVGEEGVPVAYDFSLGIELERAEALELQAELHALMEKYTGRERKGGLPYLWQVVLLPATPR